MPAPKEEVDVTAVPANSTPNAPSPVAGSYNVSFGTVKTRDK